MVADMVHRNKDKVLAAGKVVDKVDKNGRGPKANAPPSNPPAIPARKGTPKTGRSVSRLLDQ